MPSQVLTKGVRMLRFLTPTEPWRERVVDKVSLPGEWPLLLIEILHGEEDGHLIMTCALGVPQASLKAFMAQGALLFEFAQLPKNIVEVLDAHFAQVQTEIALKVDSIKFFPERQLFLVKR